MKTDLWIATGNAKKRDELVRLLAPLGYRVRTLDEAPDGIEIVEDQDTFADNARIKAAALATAVSALAVGDDSGLSVDALGGRPGVHSARWAGPRANDRERIEKLLDEMAGESNRRAKFTCHLCLVGPDGEVLAAIEEHCEGEILTAPRGEGGFGYDPVFVAGQHAGEDHPRTFAELPASEKDAISHRGHALRKLVAFLSDKAETGAGTEPS